MGENITEGVICYLDSNMAISREHAEERIGEDLETIAAEADKFGIAALRVSDTEKARGLLLFAQTLREARRVPIFPPRWGDLRVAREHRTLSEGIKHIDAVLAELEQSYNAKAIDNAIALPTTELLGLLSNAYLIHIYRDELSEAIGSPGATFA